MKKINALEKRTLEMDAEGDNDVPEALRMVADELENEGGYLVSFSIAPITLDGTFDPGVNPDDLDPEDNGPQAPPERRKDLRIAAEIHKHIER